MLQRLGLRVRILLFFAVLAVGANVAVAVGLAFAYRRISEPALLPAFQQVGLVSGFVILGLVTWVWYLFDANVALPIIRLAGKLRARAHAGVDGAIEEPTARYLGDLAPAASATALTLAETRNALAESVARETSRLSAEKARLEALLSDVPVGVLLCSGDHQLVFYNGPATDLMHAVGAPGLDRNLFDYLREGPIRHAHQRLTEAGDPDAASDILCTTVVGARVLAARMRLIAGETTKPGYVLTLRDVTSALASYARREALLAEVFDRLRRPAANLQTLFEVLPAGTCPPPNVERALREEVAGLALAVNDLGRKHEENRHDGWPLAITRASDLLDGLRARLEQAGLSAEVGDAPLLLRCNGFEVIGLVATVAARVAARRSADRFRVTLTEDGTEAMLRLHWQGAPLPVGLLEDWLAEPLEPGVPEVTGRTVLSTHMTEIWPESAGAGERAVCLPLRAARRTGPRPPAIPRAVVYDFDLLSKARNEKVADTRLESLTYVVFDTETTGLMPSQDEIVQIAAVRIVNGRRVEGEVFDTLVNPRRPIPPTSTEVHGITDAMVADAPDIVEVGRAFHKFAEGAVLVAHNAPFDMEFLRRAEPYMSRRFDNPILDTVLLSAVLFGQAEVHSLDALTHRLGITIPEEARHTAIGDTVATAEAFLKLLPMLQGRGFETFGSVLSEVRRHGRLLTDLNESHLTEA
ncbi:3'-5' exonuclease [Cereibacter sphaeroides]|uniref:3'-5' exonuclease n=1 Tax=Rhodobacterales TaxID=204455 RepID=UPI000BBEF99E|nr:MULTISPECIES: 3'-5' exonuclease [Paracoccaceae]MCE6958245.1 3'-5' exonuclease [Cereibacter sphaeroides]MCE6967724.1 3'-5' exonuclease [Cereibacter sphaeroides]MCE6972535.1 3'-5' exonuclease [Cereibacter sphaeroides]